MKKPKFLHYSYGRPRDFLHPSFKRLRRSTLPAVQKNQGYFSTHSPNMIFNYIPADPPDCVR